VVGSVVGEDVVAAVNSSLPRVSPPATVSLPETNAVVAVGKNGVGDVGEVMEVGVPWETTAAEGGTSEDVEGGVGVGGAEGADIPEEFRPDEEIAHSNVTGVPGMSKEEAEKHAEELDEQVFREDVGKVRAQLQGVTDSSMRLLHAVVLCTF
jgi:hypothetical protein